MSHPALGTAPLLAAAAIVLAGSSGRARAETVYEPLLTLEDAVAAAYSGNHLVANAVLEVRKSEDRAAALRTRRLPSLRLDVLELALLNPLDFTFPVGTFGVFPQIGPFPPVESRVRTPTGFTTTLLVTASEPLTQQYRISLGLHALELERDLAKEQLRRERQRVADEVRTAYTRLAATQAGVVALRDLVRALQEVDRLTVRYLEEQLVLRTEALEVKSRLAREQYHLASAESGLATQREHLNQLLGRDIATPFRVSDVSELPPTVTALTLEAARERARTSRPEIREARLRSEQAQTNVRRSHADWIPDVTLVGAYLQLVNFQFLPDHAAGVGLYLTWEPFDWGRRSKEASERSRTVEQARNGLVEADQQVAVEVGMRWRKLREDGQLLQANRYAVEAARENLRTIRERYGEDAKVLRDLLQAEARLSGARHDYSDALAGYWAAAADLQRAIGDED